jgi:hypothetical protein
MTRRAWAILGVSLALVLVCALSTATLWATYGAVRVGGTKLRWRMDDHTAATSRATARYQVGDSPELVVDSAAGGVTVTVGSAGLIEVETVKTAWSNNTAAARAELESVRPTARQTGDTVALAYRQPENEVVFGDGRRAAVGYNVTVPAGTRVKVDTGFGDIRLEGTRAPAELTSDYGEILVAEVRGGEPLSAQTNFGGVSVRDVEVGTLSLGSDFGEVRADDFSAGTFEARTDHGQVLLNDGRASGALTARTDTGKVAVGQVAADSYDLSSNLGPVHLNGGRGPMRLHSDFGGIEVTDAVDAVLDLSTGNGAISFAGSLAEGRPQTASSDFGPVVLAIPAGSRFDVLLTTDFGSVESELPLTVQGSGGDNRLEGALNGGGARLEVRSDNGSVRLARLAAGR